MRDTRLPAPGSPLTVDASPNGGIQVEGWDEPDVLVRAVVRTYAETEAEAAQLLSGVRVIRPEEPAAHWGRCAATRPPAAS